MTAPLRIHSLPLRAFAARVRIFPGDVEIKNGGHVVFNAIAFDQVCNAVGSLEAKCGSIHEERNHPLTTSSHRAFVSAVHGRFVIMAEIAGRKEQVKATVMGECAGPTSRADPRPPNLRANHAASIHYAHRSSFSWLRPSS